MKPPNRASIIALNILQIEMSGPILTCPLIHSMIKTYKYNKLFINDVEIRYTYNHLSTIPTSYQLIDFAYEF